MAVNRSLGGIGKLYREDALVGEVYYNIRQDPQRNSLFGSLVFLDTEVELPNDNHPYRLWLEDGRHIIFTLQRSPLSLFSPWSFVSCDGILHQQPDPSYSS